MSIIDDLFRRLRASGEKALMPFIPAGDPDLEFTGALIRELSDRGCALCELGIPYSDPIADGPVIQASYTRALNKRIQVEPILQLAGTLIPTITMPMVTMVSYAVIHRRGLERFIDQAQAAGIAGAIVPDLLIEESAPLADVCRRRDFSLIHLVTPTTPRERAVRIAQVSTGFLYYVSVTGITGERTELPPALVESVGWLREQTDLPICIGFGINKPEHAQLLAPVADGLIVGSAIVRRIAEAESRPRQVVLREIGQLVTELLTAMRA